MKYSNPKNHGSIIHFWKRRKEAQKQGALATKCTISDSAPSSQNIFRAWYTTSTLHSGSAPNTNRLQLSWNVIRVRFLLWWRKCTLWLLKKYFYEHKFAHSGSLCLLKHFLSHKNLLQNKMLKTQMLHLLSAKGAFSRKW